MDDELLQRLQRFVQLDDLSQLVSELLEERVRQLEQAETDTAMRDGYLATRRYRQVLQLDWQVVDGEGGQNDLVDWSTSRLNLPRCARQRQMPASGLSHHLSLT